MGCAHGKCCSCYLSTSSRDRKNYHEQRQLKGGNRKVNFNQGSLEHVGVPSHNIELKYSVLTQSGHYPDFPEKENEDSLCVKTCIQGNPNVHFFGVFDGHGQFGMQCSNFIKRKLVDIIDNDLDLLKNPDKTLNLAFFRANEDLHESNIDDSMSGTTAITVLLIGNELFVANVGDSRAVIAIKKGNTVVAENLSHDQTPFRDDEYERVKQSGARILSVDQVEGYKDSSIQTWDNEENQGGDPPRLWVQNGMYPGTAFTRSLGDSIAEGIGVIAIPEISMIQLTPNHLFFIVASDGVFEFLSSQAVVDMAARHSDPRDACAAIVRESHKMWMENENRTDDITIILVQIKHSSLAGGAHMLPDHTPAKSQPGEVSSSSVHIQPSDTRRHPR